jgi:hypothetical protein
MYRFYRGPATRASTEAWVMDETGVVWVTAPLGRSHSGHLTEAVLPHAQVVTCTFHKKEINYLGLIIGKGAVRMDPIKVEGITKWLVPTTVKQVRSFLGLCNFYCAFIPKFSDIAWPLNDLTKKNYQWCWETGQQGAFEELKCICAKELVLCTPDWNKPFIMETDASGYALGVVIAQEHKDGIHPIAFHSRSLLDAEKNYDAHDKEMLGVIYGLKMGRKFFLGA